MERYQGILNLLFSHKGRMNYTPDGLSSYDGEWVNNVRHGFGTRQYPSQNVYEGMWFNNMRHGEGTMRWLNRNQMYIGQWENGTQVSLNGQLKRYFYIHSKFWLVGYLDILILSL